MAHEGVAELPTRQIGDFRAFDPQDFWPALEARGWCRPYDAEGCRRPFDEMPDRLHALQDDPFRSLASALRRAGGYSKGAAPFSEFAWADFLRHHISKDAIAGDFEGSLERALILAANKSDAATSPPFSRPPPDRVAKGSKLAAKERGLAPASSRLSPGSSAPP
jgi:hypothetical protein